MDDRKIDLSEENAEKENVAVKSIDVHVDGEKSDGGKSYVSLQTTEEKGNSLKSGERTPDVPSLEGLTEENLFKNLNMKEELKNKIKALLFASGKELTLKEITLLVRKRDRRPVLYCLKELKNEYNNSKEPIVLLDDNLWKWRMTLKERYIPVVEKIVTQTELTKSMIETLAVIAWKAPVTQSEVIHVRTNKAYGHIKELEEMGYITTEKFGRTRLIKLAKKFFDYFDIDKDRLKESIQSLLPDKKKRIHEETREKGEEVYDPEMS